MTDISAVALPPQAVKNGTPHALQFVSQNRGPAGALAPGTGGAWRGACPHARPKRSCWGDCGRGLHLPQWESGSWVSLPEKKKF